MRNRLHPSQIEDTHFLNANRVVSIARELDPTILDRYREIMRKLLQRHDKYTKPSVKNCRPKKNTQIMYGENPDDSLTHIIQQPTRTISLQTQPLAESAVTMITVDGKTPRIHWETQDPTGKKEAALAGALFSGVQPYHIMDWWQKRHPRAFIDILPHQTPILPIVLTGIMSQVHRVLMYHTTENNLHAALTPEEYRHIVDYGVDISLSLTSVYSRKHDRKPQLLHDDMSDSRVIITSLE